MLEKLPACNKLLVRDHQINALLSYLRKHLDMVNEMQVPKMSHNEAYTGWMEKLVRLEDQLLAFVRSRQWMLEEFFQKLPLRRRQDYIRAY